MKIRTRFAPSPTGRMHIGNLRTALYAYLVAKHEGGDFLLRIEDTDTKRELEGAVDIIYDSLKLANLKHDEGPDIGGPVGPYVQSERVAQGIYMKYALELVEKKKAYYCFCSQERLDSLKQVVGEEEIQMYDKHCLSLTQEEIEKNLSSGMPFVIRQNIDQNGTTTFHDEIYGDITVENSTLDDMILIKSDGYPTYNFANVIDDHLMGITHVVRGCEYLSSTPKYDLLYKAFGWEIPKYIHCPHITDETHKKLSKRSGHSSYQDLLEQGFLSDCVVNFVALLGWSPEGEFNEIFDLNFMVKNFDYKRISKSSAVFDTTKLKWMNSEYIKKLDFDKFYELYGKYVKDALINIKEEQKIKKITSMVQTRIELYTDIKPLLDFFNSVPEYSNDLYNNKKSKCDPNISKDILTNILPILKNIDNSNFNNDNLFSALSNYGMENEIKTNLLMWPIRVALSGKESTPCGATEILEILGKDESINRIENAIKKLSL